jgi:hypothetical protein
LRGLLESTRDDVASTYNGIRCSLKYQRHHRGDLLITRRQAANDRQVFAFNKALCAQLIEKCKARRLVSSHRHYQRDAIETAWFLRVHAEGACEGGTTSKTNELASLHVPPKIQ